MRSWAMINGRDFCIPDDVKSVFPMIAVHRLGSQDPRTDPINMVHDILQRVRTP